MAISDALATFANDTALNTGAAGNYVIGDQIDLGVANGGLGAMIGLGALYLVIVVEDAASSGGSATASFSLLTDDDSAMGSPTVLATTAVLPVASMTAGLLVAVIALPISTGVLRYLGLRQTTGTAAFTGGTINAYITPTPPYRYAYPQNDAISY
jgi:hypothetical protein